VPYTPPTLQTLADLVVRRSQQRDCSPSAPRRRPTPPPSPVSAVGGPKVVGISSEPPPAPPRHRQSPWRPRRRQHPRGVPRPTKVYPTPLLSLSCLDKIRLPRPNLCGSDLEYNNDLLEDLKDGNNRVKWLDREPYAYWKGNPSVSVTRQELVKCNVSNTQDWISRIYNQVTHLLILLTMPFLVLGKTIVTPFLPQTCKHV
jgi:hypothetical protein